jgi:hypothetical protein
MNPTTHRQGMAPVTMVKENSAREPGMLVCRHQSFKLAAEAFQDKLK